MAAGWELTSVDNYKDQILGWDTGAKHLPVDQPVSPMTVESS